MSILKDIKEELKYYGKLTRDIIDDYKESQVKKRIAKHEEETARILKAKQARHAYYTELITQCNCNVTLIRAKINSYQANIASLGKRGHKDVKERLTREIQWLKNKLKEEEFLSNHYTRLRNE